MSSAAERRAPVCTVVQTCLDKDTVALLEPSLQTMGPLRDVFWDPSHLNRTADDGDVGDDPNEEGSDKVDAESFTDDESTAHRDRADEPAQDNRVKMCHRGNHYQQTGYSS